MVSRCREFRPKEPTYWFNLGIAYHRVGNLPAAKAAYQFAHELEPNNSEYANAADLNNSN
jgi:Flp pilus assembly protein TadD